MLSILPDGLHRNKRQITMDNNLTNTQRSDVVKRALLNRSRQRLRELLEESYSSGEDMKTLKHPKVTGK